jgi:hypothetical protein
LTSSFSAVSAKASRATEPCSAFMVSTTLAERTAPDDDNVDVPDMTTAGLAATVPACRSTSARCSQMLTLLCGRSHESREDEGPSLSRTVGLNDVMFGSWLLSNPPGWTERAVHGTPSQPGGRQRRGRRGCFGCGSLATLDGRVALRLPVGYRPGTGADVSFSISVRCRAKSRVAILLAIVLPRRDLAAIGDHAACFQ